MVGPARATTVVRVTAGQPVALRTRHVATAAQAAVAVSDGTNAMGTAVPAASSRHALNVTTGSHRK